MSLTNSLQDYISTQVSDADTTYTVFQAKPPFQAEWVDSRLQDRVKIARKTYQDFYSPDIPLLDEYDPKSAIYICSATYRSQEFGDPDTLVREWLSVRFTPYQGEPFSNFDIELQKLHTSNKRVDLLSALQEKHADWDAEELRQGVWAISRLCAIRPYIVSEKNEDEIVWSQVYLSNTKTLSCFVLMFRQFFLDFGDRYPMEYFTCQIHPKVAEKIFEQSIQGYNFQLPFAADVLNVDQSSVRLDWQANEKYIFSYPGYFLDLTELVGELNHLIESGRLPMELIEAYLPINVRWSKVVESPHFSYFSKLGGLITAETFPPGVQVTPAELRAHLRESVSDGVQLRLLTKERAQQQIAQLPLFLER